MNEATVSQRRKLDRGIAKEIKHLERCRRMLKRVDLAVYTAGIDFLESEERLALWLCEPAKSLGGKLPLAVMRTKRGRQKVARVLSRHGRNIDRLVPADGPSVDRSVFARMRALRARLSLGKGETARDLINAGRREKFFGLAGSCPDLPVVPPHTTPDIPRDE